MASRHRSFMAVFYPESAPEEFREQIAAWTVPALLALHDRDEDKKPHYHLLLLFGGMKSLAQVRPLIEELGSSMIQPVYDTRASARYLAHLDHPEKFQYGVGAIEAFSGASIEDLTTPLGDPSPQIIDFCRQQGLYEYSTLVNYCRDQKPEWFQYVSRHSIFLTHYLRSVRHGDESRLGVDQPTTR